MNRSMRCRASRVVAAGALLGALVCPAPAPAARIISLNSSDTDSGNLQSGLDENDFTHTMGDFVVFQSAATDLTATPDTNAVRDIFLRDMTIGTTTLVSINASGTAAGNGQSNQSRVTADGRWVLFDSEATDLVAGDANGAGDVFLRDMQSGVTTLVSVASGGGSGNDWSDLSDFSPDGRYAVFYSDATDLVAETDTNGARDVFVRDLQADTTTLVSVDASGTSTGNNQSNFGVITPDGHYMLFHASASDLVAVDTNGLPDVFRRDLQTQTTELVSINLMGTDSGDSTSYNLRISDDGSVVTFESGATDLVAIPDNNGLFDLFVRDMVAGITSLVTVNSAGTEAGNGSIECCPAGLTPDGRFILFSSTASDLAPPDSDTGRDVFLHDRQLGTNTLITISADGTTSGNGGSGDGSISEDGRFIGFASGADNLVADDTNAASDVFVRDTVEGTTSLLSRNLSGDSATGDSNGALLSANNRWLLFDSDAPDLASVDTNGAEDVFRAVVPGVIFTDGFESGDTSAWSNTVP